MNDLGPVSALLTYPPSANRLWRNVKGKTLKSAEYRAWLIANAGAGKGKATTTGFYKLTVLASAPDKRRRDLDNIIKPIGDCIQQIGLVTDDANMRQLVAEWVYGPSPAVGIFIEPLIERAFTDAENAERAEIMRRIWNRQPHEAA
jgi:crossover junction endodeoxyribonuclease RusA